MRKIGWLNGGQRDFPNLSTFLRYLVVCHAKEGTNKCWLVNLPPVPTWPFLARSGQNQDSSSHPWRRQRQLIKGLSDCWWHKILVLASFFNKLRDVGLVVGCHCTRIVYTLQLVELLLPASLLSLNFFYSLFLSHTHR